MPTARKPANTALAKEVGQRIRERRERLGKSLGDMRDATGIDPSNLSKIERGESVTDLGRYALIARALEMSLATLFRGLTTPAHCRGL